MERDHLQENAEYAVNNVKYQVSASFQTPDDKIPAEDFADKLKTVDFVRRYYESQWKKVIRTFARFDG